MRAPRAATERGRAALRVALSHYVANGLSVALGLLLISGGVHLVMGVAAAAAAGVGVIVTAPPDLPGPRRGKFWQMVPSPLVGLPLFFCVQLLHSAPLRLGLLLVPATFLAFVAMAWGKRGIPIAIAIMFSMIFSMATPAPTGMHETVERTLYFGLGAALYVIYALLANHALNGRYRVQAMADLLSSLAALMRTEALQFTPIDEAGDVREVPSPLLGRLLGEQAALADQLQATRDIVLESPRTPRRQRLAGMLVTVLELRDMLLASELDLDALKSHPGHAAALCDMQRILLELADETVALADALLLGRRPEPVPDRRPELAAIHLEEDAAHLALAAGPTPAVLARGLASRVGHINDEVLRLSALARGDIEPDLAVVRASWQMFVSPTDWSWRPFLKLWKWDAPPLRHAIRAALAIAAGYGIASAMPWGSHDYWILLTIVVVLRGSLSQTLERRNSRVAGTLLGCVLATALLSAHPSAIALLLCVTIAQAVAHGFAIRRYLITAVAATEVTRYLRTAKPCAMACAAVMATSVPSAPGWMASSATATTQPSSVPATRLLRRSSVCERLPRSTTTIVSRIQ